mmetsp:Transcript_40684/g.82092  ORF Transcript_40684/g.82092 Transcript_40684/m.82092 type:complete len:924 (-) Transcript_40684:150-2921(-)
MATPFVASRYAATLGLSIDLVSGTCMSDDDDNGHCEVDVELRRSVRDVDENRRRTWVHRLQYRSSTRSWRTKPRSRVQPPFELPSECSFVGQSPSGERSLRVTKVGKKGGGASVACLEVWQGSNLLTRVSAEGLHEGVSATSAGLGGLAWTPDETRVVYVAERCKHPAGSGSFFDNNDPSPSSSSSLPFKSEGGGVEALSSSSARALGTDFELRDDWGEKLAGSDRVALFSFDFASGAITELPGSTGSDGDALTPAQPVVVACPQDPSSLSVVFVAYPHKPKKLGLVYCFQRPCHLRRVALPPANSSPLLPATAVAAAATASSAAALSSAFEVLTPHEAVAFSPRLSGKGDKLAYLSSAQGFDTHVGALEISILDLAQLAPLSGSMSTSSSDQPSSKEQRSSKEERSEEIVPPLLLSRRVIVPSTAADRKEMGGPALDPACPGGFTFPGVWWPGELPEQCWGENDECLWFTSLWGSRPSAFVVDTGLSGSNKVTRVPFGGVSSPQFEDCAVKVLSACPRVRGALVSWSSPTNPGGVALVVPAEEEEGEGGDGGWAWVGAPPLGRQAVVVTKASAPSSAGQVSAAAASAGRWFASSSSSSSPATADDDSAAAAATAAASNGSGGKGALSGNGQGGAQEEESGWWRVLSVVPPDSATGLPMEAILVVPPRPSASASEAPLGLIVVPHGGPHSTTPTSFVGPYNFLAAETNCAVLHVNYRGSLGFGADELNSLPGKIGTQDVADVVLATQTALALTDEKSKPALKLLDSTRVAVVGGSHGGFLAGHLIGQHPDLFKVAAMRNPVTNIPSMVGVTDIPDWCFVEALGVGAYDFNQFSPAKPPALAKMFECSPVAHIDKVRAPTLLCLGFADRRVPSSQGVEFFHALKSRGVPTRCLMYPEDSHPIDKPESEADHWINVAQWINEHLR